ncbi:unnamed protein product [Prorocentrum cordatum]|uniref:Prolyl 4-hydroxylase alpha subunit Fe(2+) 2OG dioxygenase domain-containing protein n=1 Tax=Prorocentrum cordatum TaxID=2364126 RepID=A0ABN9RW60_9DINO|nr:unnamed protein product [Polarella glacialis]
MQLEGSKDGRSVSNRGGWQSKDLTGSRHRSLSVLARLLPVPAAAFLWRQRRGEAPSRLRDTASAGELCITTAMDSLWANVNRPGNWNARHDHGTGTPSVIASCVYYPGGGACGAAGIRLFPEGRPVVRVVPRPGLLLLFPPWLEHEVEPLPAGCEPRVSVAFNVRVRWPCVALHRASLAGCLDDVLQLVHAGADLDAADPALGLAAIHLAAEAGHAPVVEALAAAGGSVSQVSHEGWSPLGLAADRGHEAVVSALLGMGGGAAPEAGPALSAPLVEQSGWAGVGGALAVAAARGHLGVARLLAGDPGHQPLGFAAAEGHAALVEHLLSRRAAVGGPPAEPGGARLRSPLHEAAGRGHAEVVKLLLGGRADPCARDADGAYPDIFGWRLEPHRAAIERLAIRTERSPSSLRLPLPFSAFPSIDGLGSPPAAVSARSLGPL